MRKRGQVDQLILVRSLVKYAYTLYPLPVYRTNAQQVRKKTDGLIREIVRRDAARREVLVVARRLR